MMMISNFVATKVGSRKLQFFDRQHQIFDRGVLTISIFSPKFLEYGDFQRQSMFLKENCKKAKIGAINPPHIAGC